MKTLVQIMNESNNLMFELAEAGGELTPEIEAKITNNALMLSDKLDSYGYVIEAFKQRQVYAMERLKEWERMITLCEKAIDNLNARAVSALADTESGEVHGKEFSFKLALNPISIVIEDESKVPGDFIITETKHSTRIDKKAIKDAIMAGQEVPGAKATRTERLMMKTSQRKNLEEIT